MKAHIFLIANLKFCLQTPCSFGDMAENVKLIGIPINNFLCIYIIASSPGLHTLFCLWRVNKKLPQGETSQNTFQRSRSISWKCKTHMVKWAYPPLSSNSLYVYVYVYVLSINYEHKVEIWISCISCRHGCLFLKRKNTLIISLAWFSGLDFSTK